VSGVPTPIWLRPERPPRATGRPAEWSREQVVRAAIAVAERDGLAAVTTRRVAAELGTGSASLYRHIANRADLLDLMVDTASGAYRPPPVTGRWREDLVAEVMHRVRYLRARPWLTDAFLERPPVGPAALRLLEHTLEQLRDHPAPGTAKLEAVGVLTGLVQTYLRNERPGGGALDPEFAKGRAEIFARAATDGAHPRLAEVLAQAPATDPESNDDQFARVVGLMLDGLLPR
jgi:AcrR family transcriptional regulator